MPETYATRLVAGCKINLGLHVSQPLANGYHLIKSIFYPLPWPADEILIFGQGKAAAQDAQLDCRGRPIANGNEENLIIRSMRAFAKASGQNLRISALLKKRIPVGAGLGGGSSDAAAMLQYLNSRAATPIPSCELAKTAASIGADVPFFLRNVPCAAGGIGEKLAPIIFDAQEHWLLLVWPGLHVSTAWAFRALDEMRAQAKNLTSTQNGASETIPASGNAWPDLQRANADCASNPAVGQIWHMEDMLRAGGLANDLEMPVFVRYPVLSRIKRQMLAMDAAAAAMSGSGSCIYGIFQSERLARNAAAAMRECWPLAIVMPLRNSGM